MKILQQLGILFGLCWLSRILERVLPFPLPASVIALLLGLILLMTHLLRTEQIGELSDFLLSNLSFFFIPVSAGLMNYTDVLRESGAAFLVICVVSMILTFGATAWAVRLTDRLLHCGAEKEDSQHAGDL